MRRFLSVLELSSSISHCFLMESSRPWVVIGSVTATHFLISLVPGSLLVTVPACYLAAWCAEPPLPPWRLPDVAGQVFRRWYLLCCTFSVAVAPDFLVCGGASSLSHCWYHQILILTTFLWVSSLFQLEMWQVKLNLGWCLLATTPFSHAHSSFRPWLPTGWLLCDTW